MNRCKPLRTRRGLTLFEVMTATTMMATLMASSVVLVRSSYSVWQATEADLERAENAYAVLRHVVRNVRQASAVSAISTASDTAGSLSLLMDTGDTRLWARNAGTDQVFYGVAPSSADQLLVESIDELLFVGYEADGVTATTTPADIQMIHCIARITMPAGGGQSRTVSCKAWLRSW